MSDKFCFAVSSYKCPVARSFKEQHSGDQEPSSSSSGTLSPPNLLPASARDKSHTTFIEPPTNRERLHADVTGSHNRGPDSTSPTRKRQRICEERSLMTEPCSDVSTSSRISPKISSPERTSPVKRHYSDISTGSNGRSEASSSERKRHRISEEVSPLKKPCSVISTDGKTFSKISSQKRRTTTDREEKHSAVTPSTSEDARSTVIQLNPQKRKQKAWRSPSDTTTSDSTQRQKKDDARQTKVWIIGSSYIRRGEAAARETFGKNLGLNASVEWFGKGGMRWSGVLPRFYSELSTQSPPDILVIHAGGNDLGLISPKELASVMKRDLMQLHAQFPSMTIVFSSINERQAWRYGKPCKIDKDRKAVNTSMSNAAGYFGGDVIEHPLLRFFNQRLFLPDAVHFTDEGNSIFLTSIQSALRRMCRKQRWGSCT